MKNVFICDAVRTPVGKYGGSLATVRTDDLAAMPITEMMRRHENIDWSSLDDVVLGCANQAGEDNRNVARMALLLAGLPYSVPGVTINRLCGSGMDAVGYAARSIANGEADLIMAGGVESMSRAPYVMPKPGEGYNRSPEIHDTTLGWRFVNKKLEESYGVESMISTAENLVDEFRISREAQDKYAHFSQLKTSKAQQDGHLAREIMAVTVPQRKGDPLIFSEDEHPRLSSLEKLASLKPIVRADGTVTAGNASGINDGSAAILLASEEAVRKHGLEPICMVSGVQAAGVLPRVMGIGPVYATNRLLERLKLSLPDFDLIEINEAFAAQVLSCLKLWNLEWDDPRINPLGGAIALGHPLGMSGARLVTTASMQMKHGNADRALCTMCIGVGQGISMVLQRV